MYYKSHIPTLFTFLPFYSLPFLLFYLFTLLPFYSLPFLPFYLFTLLLLKEHVAYCYCGDDASKIGEQSAGYGMARVAHADGAEVDGEDVERGVGGALEDAREASHEGVGAVGCHGVDHHAARAAVGRAPTKSVLPPSDATPHLMPPMSMSIAPEARKTPMPTRMATR